MDEMIRDIQDQALTNENLVDLVRELERAQAAVRTLEMLGYTHNGGKLWAPSVGERIDLRRDVLAKFNAPFSCTLETQREGAQKWTICDAEGFGIAVVEQDAFGSPSVRDPLEQVVGLTIAEALNDYWRKHNVG